MSAPTRPRHLPFFFPRITSASITAETAGDPPITSLYGPIPFHPCAYKTASSPSSISLTPRTTQCPQATGIPRRNAAIATPYLAISGRCRHPQLLLLVPFISPCTCTSPDALCPHLFAAGRRLFEARRRTSQNPPRPLAAAPSPPTPSPPSHQPRLAAAVATFLERGDHRTPLKPPHAGAATSPFSSEDQAPLFLFYLDRET